MMRRAENLPGVLATCGHHIRTTEAGSGQGGSLTLQSRKTFVHAGIEHGQSVYLTSCHAPVYNKICVAV